MTRATYENLNRALRADNHSTPTEWANKWATLFSSPWRGPMWLALADTEGRYEPEGDHYIAPDGREFTLSDI